MGREFHLTTILPGKPHVFGACTPNLPHLGPEISGIGRRFRRGRMPAAMEVIKLISGCGEILRGRLLAMDLRTSRSKVRIRRLPRCLDLR